LDYDYKLLKNRDINNYENKLSNCIRNILVKYHNKIVYFEYSNNLYLNKTK